MAIVEEIAAIAASAGTLASGKSTGWSLRRTLRRALQGMQFGVLYLWHSATEPPRVLAFNRATNGRLLRAFGATIGKDVRLQPPLVFNLGAVGYRNLTIGDGCVLNGNNYIDLNEPVTLEAGASLGPSVTISTHNRFNFNPFLEKRLARLCGRGPVTIGAGAGIKAHAVILHGVTVGAESVVAGGSFVVKDVPPRSWVAGSPAVVKMKLD